MLDLSVFSSVCFKSKSDWKIELLPDELAPKISVSGRMGMVTVSPNALKLVSRYSRNMFSFSTMSPQSLAPIGHRADSEIKQLPCQRAISLLFSVLARGVQPRATQNLVTDKKFYMTKDQTNGFVPTPVTQRLVGPGRPE